MLSTYAHYPLGQDVLAQLSSESTAAIKPCKQLYDIGLSYHGDIMKKSEAVLSRGRICNACKQEIKREMLDKNYSICPNCGYYLRMHARKRILSLADKQSFREWDSIYVRCYR